MKIFSKAIRVLEKINGRINHLEFTQCASDIYAEGPHCEWTEVYAPEKIDWPLPTVFGKRAVSFTETLPAHFPTQGVCCINHGRLLGPFGITFGPDKTRLPWHSWHRDNTPLPNPVFKSEWRLATSNHLRGNVLSLMSEYCDMNYCHLLMDSLSRFHLVQKAGLNLSDFDAVVVPGKASARKNKLLTQIGIPAEKVVWYDDLNGITADRLTVTTFPGLARCYPRWATSYISEQFSPTTGVDAQAKRSSRKLYISRAGFTRDLANLDELLPLFKKHGYEVYNPKNSSNPAADFVGATSIVGAHGAGLTDIIFAPPNSFVLELIPERHIYPYYYTLAVNSGKRYGCILGSTSFQNASQQLHHFTINPQDLASALDAIDQNSPI